MPLNTEWAKKLLDKNKERGRGDGPRYRFASLPKTGYMKFNLIEPDAEGRLGMLVFKHYNVPHEEAGRLESKHHVCVANTFPDQEVACPICDVLNKLQAEGIPETALKDYQASGKGYVRARIVDAKPDDNGPFSSDEVVILGLTEYSLLWIIQKYMDPDFGDFLDPHRCATLKFHREKANSKWERDILGNYGPLAPTEEGIQALVQAAEAIDLYKVWTFPKDEIMEVQVQDARLLATQVRKLQGVLRRQEQEGAVDHGVDRKVHDDAAVAERVMQATVSKLQGFRPAGSPTCFADPAVFSEISDKCLVCSYSVECENTIRDADDIPF